ncbi:MAG: hypothetical protein ABIJ43_01795 [Candidatus Beckwithbacteria bacterium]|nr:hypothetical protein [Patescibacteria group bacterium]
MNEIKLIEKLRLVDKSWWSLNDLGKVLLIKPSSLYTVASRLVKKGVLIRIGQGIYGVFGKTVVPEEIASSLYYPSYLSLKTVLVKAGVINQVAQEIQLMTTKRTKQIKIGETRLKYHQIKKELFFGYRVEKGMAMAYPEKALLDLFYLSSLGKAFVSFEELDMSGLDQKKLKTYSKKFSKRVQMLVKKVIGKS